jgi:hypothetical protein
VDHFWNWPCNEEYYSLLADCQQTQLARRASPSSTYAFLDVLTSTLIRRTEWIRVKEIASTDEPKSRCSSPPLCPCANMCPFESIRPKAMLPDLTTHKGLRSGPSSMDDEKDSSDRPTSLVGDGNTYRDTLSHPRAAHTVGQGLRTLNPTDTTVLKWLNEKSPGAATCIPPGVIEDGASAHEGHSPLKYSVMARTSADMTCPPKQG